MELDDLKHAWKQADSIHKPQNENIMQLIQNRSYGPIAVLKREFLRQVRVMVVIPALMVVIFAQDLDKVVTNVMLWSYISVCAGVCVFFYYNYIVLKKMEGQDGLLKSNLEQQISILETRLNWHMIGLRIALVFFIVLTEVLPLYQHARMLDKWHSLSPVVRFSVYAVLLTLQYFLSRMMCQRKFGRHLDYLKELVNEMQ